MPYVLEPISKPHSLGHSGKPKAHPESHKVFRDSGRARVTGFATSSSHNNVMLEIKEIEAKTILTKCKIPGVDYTINPYIGCSFGCKYCYASFMGRFAGQQISDWGNYVYIKTNAPILLTKELEKLKNNGEGKEIFFSSVTDPYQGLEAKYKITRKCLKTIADFKFKGVVSILTKSDLVLRDIDIFKEIKNCIIGLTITSTDDTISRYFEKYAPPVSKRLNALLQLHKQGVQTYAFIGPILPHFVSNRKDLDKLFSSLKKVGVKDIFIEHLNLSVYIRERLINEIKGSDKKIIEQFYLSQSKEYRNNVEKIINELIKKYNMRLLHDTVIFHKEFQKQKN